MMQKDFKIGLGIGLILAIAVVIWLSTLPNQSAEARALQSGPNTSITTPQSQNLVEIQQSPESYSANSTFTTPQNTVEIPVAPRSVALRSPAFRGVALRSPAFRGVALRSPAFRGVALRSPAFRGVAKIPARLWRGPSPDDPPQTRIHVVRKGETLSAIATQYYGSPRYLQKIINANRACLSDPNRLTPATRLVIPQ